MISEDFYKYALKLFKEAGYINQYNPIYINHSSEQFIYFDTKEPIYLTSTQRRYIKNFDNVSYLFNVSNDLFKNNIHQNIAFYSLELKNINQRSQSACDIHNLLQYTIEAEASILLVKYEDCLSISFYGFGQKYILSDWYYIDYDFEILLQKIDIANISMNSTKDFFLDMIYNVARGYYIYSIDKELALYYLIPINYFLNDEYDRETLKEMILNELNEPVNSYGEDYIEQVKTSKNEDINIDFEKEFDLMLIEINETEEDNIFDDEYFNEEEFEFEEEDFDEIFDGLEIDPEILNDPIAMVEWLYANSKSNQ